MRPLPRSARQAAPSRRLIIALLLAAGALALPGAPANAAFTGPDGFGNMEYTQTSATLPPTFLGDFFGSRIYYSNATDVTSASGTAGTNTLSYSFQAGTTYDYLALTSFLTPSQLNTYNGSGTSLSVNTNGGLGAQNASVVFGTTLYSSTVPALTSSTYNLLQGYNAATPATLSFNSFTAASGATSSFTFLTISNVTTGAVAYSQSFLSNSTTSVNLPANTLAPNTSYDLELDFSNRSASSITTGSSAFVGQTFTAGYDVRTEVAFTTASPAAVPEPSSLTLTGLGAAAVALVLHVRRKK